MSKFGSDQVAFCVLGGYDILSGVLISLTDKEETITEESHTLGDAWVEHSPVGVRRAELTIDAFYDDATLGIDECFSTNQSAAIGAARALVYGVEGNTTGVQFVGWQPAQVIDYERVLSRGSLHRVKATLRNGQRTGAPTVIEQGRIIKPLAGVTATGNTTGAAIDFSASNVSGGAAWLAITSLVGFEATGLVVDIMHSADNLTFSTHAGLLSVSASTPNGVVNSWLQRVVSTAPVQRYVAARWVAGTGFGTSAQFMVGFAPK